MATIPRSDRDDGRKATHDDPLALGSGGFTPPASERTVAGSWHNPKPGHTVTVAVNEGGKWRRRRIT